ncbi:MAG: enoyl-CoA hydratase [Bacteroidetes bacterium]|nr:MAG: enoyl-CoA hydratase [Bacteroidota bacterium]
MQYTNIQIDIENQVALIRINREDKMNALNIATLKEIKAAVEEANGNEAVHAIVLSGMGSKAFAAGADISEFVAFNEEQGEDMSASGHAVMNTLEQSAKPVIAAVNGFALGGGCELAMAAHIRIASENARFGQPEINLGLVPGYGGTQRLCEIVGKGRAMNLLLTGDAIKAEDALQMGLVTQVCSSEELIPAAMKLAEKLMGKSPYALAKVIELVNEHYAPARQAYNSEITEFGACFQKPDFVEGTDAFLNKRKANFHGTQATN